MCRVRLFRRGVEKLADMYTRLWSQKKKNDVLKILSGAVTRIIASWTTTSSPLHLVTWEYHGTPLLTLGIPTFTTPVLLYLPSLFSFFSSCFSSFFSSTKKATKTGGKLWLVAFFLCLVTRVSRQQNSREYSNGAHLFKPWFPRTNC